MPQCGKLAIHRDILDVTRIFAIDRKLLDIVGGHGGRQRRLTKMRCVALVDVVVFKNSISLRLLEISISYIVSAGALFFGAIFICGACRGWMDEPPPAGGYRISDRGE